MSQPCDAVRLSLGAYALGTLEPGEEHDIEAHLGSCRVCRSELAQLEPVVPLLAGLAADDVRPQGPSDDLFGRIAAAAEAAGATSSPRPHRWLPARSVVAAAASVLLVAGVGAAVGLATSSDRPGDIVASSSDGGVQLTVRATEQGTGTRLDLTVSGLPEHEQCHLVAEAADGSVHDAGSWAATYDGTARVTEATDVAQADLRRLALYDEDGRRLVFVDLAR